MEDGACLAVCLQLAGKEQVSDALKAFEKIRYDRVRKIQKTGETSKSPSRDHFTALTLISTGQVAQGRLRIIKEEPRGNQIEARGVGAQPRR